MNRMELINVLRGIEVDDALLTRRQAREIIDVVLGSMVEALQRGEKVVTPIGNFEVVEHKRPPLRGWFLNRVRLTYRKSRKFVRFTYLTEE